MIIRNLFELNEAVKQARAKGQGVKISYCQDKGDARLARERRPTGAYEIQANYKEEKKRDGFSFARLVKARFGRPRY